MKGLKSIFLKNFVIYSLVVMLSFTALGGAFIYQINRYSAEERQSILNSTARRAEESTANYMVNQSNVMGFSRELLESSFHLNMMQLAGNLGGVIFVCDTSGQLLLLATDETCYTYSGDSGQSGVTVPEESVQTAIQEGRFYEMGTLSGLLTSPHYTLGLPVNDDQGQPMALTFVSLSADASLKLFLNISSTFILMIFIVFLLVLVVTYVMVDSTVRPLRSISAAARHSASSSPAASAAQAGGGAGHSSSAVVSRRSRGSTGPGRRPHRALRAAWSASAPRRAVRSGMAGHLLWVQTAPAHGPALCQGRRAGPHRPAWRAALPLLYAAAPKIAARPPKNARLPPRAANFLQKLR